MWQRPQLLNAIADLFQAAGAVMLLASGALWLMRQPFAPIRVAELSAPLQHVAVGEVQEALQEKARGNFMGVSMETLRARLEALPWVRKATVRRAWPDRILITLEEHVPLAHWGNPGEGSEWVDSFGEIFAAGPSEAHPELPWLKGPESSARQLLERYRETRALFEPLGLRPVRLQLSSRLALDMQLDTGLVLKLGREQSAAPIATRLARFVELYPAIVAPRVPRAQVADLRYPSGFTLYPAGRLPDGE
jgi:cell division protein FtsQ